MGVQSKRRWGRNRKCEYHGCTNPHLALGYCLEHYQNKKLRGDPSKYGNKLGHGQAWRLVQAIVRAGLRRLVPPVGIKLTTNPNGGSECWLWPNAKNGYPGIWLNGKYDRVHRVVCEMVHGPAPLGKNEALHRCDNGRLGCIHPRHLFWGTQATNMAVFLYKKGKDNPAAKVPQAAQRLGMTAEALVRKIRSLHGVKTQKAIAEWCGLSAFIVHTIIQRENWGHVK